MKHFANVAMRPHLDWGAIEELTEKILMLETQLRWDPRSKIYKRMDQRPQEMVKKAGSTLRDTSVGKDCLIRTPLAQELGPTIVSWVLIKPKQRWNWKTSMCKSWQEKENTQEPVFTESGDAVKSLAGLVKQEHTEINMIKFVFLESHELCYSEKKLGQKWNTKIFWEATTVI